jgi:hypothetical protein
MRHADAEIQLWLANDRIAREHREAELAALVRSAKTPANSVRERAGHAVIAFGERLAGESGSIGKPRRMAARSL